LEVVVVDDGSTDRTGQIAAGYAARFPGTVRVVSQPNKGHGGAINTGIADARGAYLKVVDSDDWLDPQALAGLLRRLRGAVASSEAPDMVVSGFTYDRTGRRRGHAMRFGHALPTGRLVGWEEVGRFPRGRYMLMHALTYRTQVLRDSGLELPPHTFYVDNIYAFMPLTAVRAILHLDLDLYRYCIGRPDQSVNEQVMISRIGHQLEVNRLLLTELGSRWQDCSLPVPLRRYSLHFAEAVTLVSAVLLLRSGTPEHLAAKDDLFAWLAELDPDISRRLRRGLPLRVANLPGRPGRAAAMGGYRLARRMFGFN
jgi:glycosyltransferase involved in cell wall biosynthesis